MNYKPNDAHNTHGACLIRAAYNRPTFMTVNKQARHIIVIGAGMGGLSAAISLAANGYRVTILEQLDVVGGKMGEWREAGFRFDTGPSVITMRHVYDRLFREAGRDLNDYIELIPLNPITRYHWRDGVVIDAVNDEDAMCEQIHRIAPREVDAYRRFMRYVAGLYAAVSDPFLYRRQPGLRDMLSMPLGDIFKVDALRSMHQAVTAHFRDPHLVQLFDRFATYNGSSPYLAPATFNVIAHVEMALGAWYPRGGVYQMARAYEKLAFELGVDIRTSTRVEEVIIRDREASSVRIAGGQVLRADAVVVNADYMHAIHKLIADGAGIWKPVQPLEPSCSGVELLLGVRADENLLAHHNIFFGSDYKREFDDIFARKVPPADPTLYVCITAKTDPNHAPAGYGNWFVMANAPHLSPAYDWSTHTDDYVALMKETLISWGLDVSPDKIVFERHMMPQDLQDRFGGHAGAIYGFSSNSRRAAFLRPNNRSPQVRRLYFAGGSVHPGGGVPLVSLSGIAAAECVREDID